MTDTVTRNPFINEKKQLAIAFQKNAAEISQIKQNAKLLSARQSQLKQRLNSGQITAEGYRSEHTKILSEGAQLRSKLVALTDQKQSLRANVAEVSTKFQQWEQEVRDPLIARQQAQLSVNRAQLAENREKLSEQHKKEAKLRQNIQATDVKIQAALNKAEGHRAKLAQHQGNIQRIVAKGLGVETPSSKPWMHSKKSSNVAPMYRSQAQTKGPEGQRSKVFGKHQAAKHETDSGHSSEGSSGGDSPPTRHGQLTYSN